ncbi:hypothetical protein ACHHYP_10876 [Achlya hypogyna]|uniref:Uncharacterized protein n=1 Tax=Achlya hypogyna TaxID=1202772 RepID=A0A1V9YKE3_ACHHY|nr:hypothetical protein ACHHYP_10876 [Achlya hypogyna]
MWWGSTSEHQPGRSLLDAAREGGTDRVQKLLRDGADVGHCCENSQDGRTPLHVAAYGGHTNVVKLLLDAKSDVNAREKVGLLQHLTTSRK